MKNTGLILQQQLRLKEVLDPVEEALTLLVDLMQQNIMIQLLMKNFMNDMNIIDIMETLLQF